MTNRERFAKTAAGDPRVDRCPVMEWAEWWDETITFWEGEGLEKNLTGCQLFDTFGLDRNIQLWFPHAAPDCPLPVHHGAPLIRDEADYRELKKKLFPKDAVKHMEKEIEAALPQYQDGSAVIWYTLEGFFWFPRRLFGIEGHLYAFYDEPELYHRICEDLLEWQLGVVEAFSHVMKADFMTIAEDMSYNLGPMISESCFEEFMAPYYKRLIPAIKQHGTRAIVDSDGDISRLVPWFIRSGVEGILPLERQAGVDIPALQQQYPGFIWLGGFDKMCLFKGKDAIDTEIERLRPAVRKGCFIPSVDHQTPPGVSMENYRYYLRRLWEISGEACKDAPSLVEHASK